MVKLMKVLFVLILFLIFGCSSDTPVNMDDALFDSGGRYKSIESLKVYSGPGFKKYKNGKKQEEGPLEYGWKVGTWTGWYEDGRKKFVGDYLEGLPNGSWTGFHPNGQKKYEGNYKFGHQVGKWIYFNKKGNKNLEEEYFVCENDCDETHPSLGKIIKSEKF